MIRRKVGGGDPGIAAARALGDSSLPVNDLRLTAIDLNLLIALDALLEEGNVTRAAARIGLTQPAMSHALNRLRKILGDPLLVRTPRGMRSTPRADALMSPIRRALTDIERALSERPAFEPRSSRRTFTLAAVDYGELVILPPLLARLPQIAPGIDIVVRQLRMEDIDEQLEEGTIDLAIGVLNEEDKPAAFQQRLFQERFVCVLRADHPAVGDTLSLEQFVELNHALISPRGRRGGLVEQELKKLGLSRRIALTVPHFLVAPLVVAHSDLVLTVAARIAKAFEGMLPLRVVETPLQVPGFSVTQFWHERQQQDPAHAWLRGLIMDLCRTL
jgi:DNA-binding transcriptional LysR family regulator